MAEREWEGSCNYLLCLPLMKHCLLCSHCFTAAAHLCICLSGWLTWSAPPVLILNLLFSHTESQERCVALLTHTNMRTLTQRRLLSCCAPCESPKTTLLMFPLLWKAEEAQRTYLVWCSDCSWEIFLDFFFLTVIFKPTVQNFCSDSNYTNAVSILVSQ